jgi:AbrB family looped-hinge helix DNA binding protein
MTADAIAATPDERHGSLEKIVLRNLDRSEICMSTITVSSKYQIVIPLKIREALGIRPGEKLHAIEYRGRIELVPVRPTKSARGSLKGIDTDVPRESDRV